MTLWIEKKNQWDKAWKKTLENHILSQGLTCIISD